MSIPAINVRTSYLPITLIHIKAEHPIAIGRREIILSAGACPPASSCIDDDHAPGNDEPRDEVRCSIAEAVRMLRDGVEREVLAVATAVSFDGGNHDVCPKCIEGGCDDCGYE